MAETATAAPPELAPDLVELRRRIRELVRARVAPRAAEIDARADYPWDVRELLAAHDVLALPFGVEHGGTGTGTLMLNAVVEDIATACASSALILMLQELGTLPIQLFGTSAQKRAWLPRCASGEWAPAFALSEVESTTAVRDGDEWVITGAKHSVCNAGIADFYVVFATTDRERRRSTAFVVEADRPGLSVGRLEHRLGIRGAPTGSLVFEDVRVPDEHRVGEVGAGSSVGLATLERGRLGAAAQAVGIARRATDHAALHAADRHRMAQMASRTAAARELLYRACAMADSGEQSLGTYSAMARLFASEVAMEAAIWAAQVPGSVTDGAVERMLRDATVTQVREDAEEMRRLAVG